ncbi:hypothetical protein [Streptacidiphilus sp. MAP12-20]|uniref:hypothetical protein n=1 Tax=Streptacidiphilus sp. MAP12-20 TaxID=3156299 RepID=UPI00351477DB
MSTQASRPPEDGVGAGAERGRVVGRRRALVAPAVALEPFAADGFAGVARAVAAFGVVALAAFAFDVPAALVGFLAVAVEGGTGSERPEEALGAPALAEASPWPGRRGCVSHTTAAPAAATGHSTTPTAPSRPTPAYASTRRV